MIKALPAEVWVRTRTVANPQLSPAGLISFITDYGSGNELVVIEAVGGPEQLLSLVPRPTKTYAWTPTGGIVYVATDKRLYIHTDERTDCLTGEPGDFSALAVSPDGRHVAFVDDLHDLKVVNLEAGSSAVTVASDADFIVDPVWLDDERLAWHEWDAPDMAWDASRIAMRSITANAPITVIAGGDDHSVQQPRLSPDGKWLAFLSDANGWLNLWIIDTATFTDKTCVLVEQYEHGDPTWGAGQRSFCWSTATELLVGRNHDGGGTLVSVDIEGEIFSEINGVFTDVFGLDGRAVALRSDFNSGDDLMYIDDDEIDFRVYGTPEELAGQGVEPRTVDWLTDDGTTLHGRFYASPDPHERNPLIIWLHGGPTHQSRATLYSRWSHFLSRGYNVFVVDYRGSTGWGRSYQQAMRNNWGIVDPADIASAIEMAVANDFGAADAVVVMGGSAGGFSALHLLAEYPSLCAAGVVTYPVSDLVALSQDTWRFEAHYCDTLVGEYDHDLYHARSPLPKAGRIEAPLLVLHGDDDVVVPVDQSRQLVETMRAAGRNPRFHVYEGEGHGWRKPETRIDELQRVDAFLSEYVLRSVSDTESGQ